MGKQNKTQNQTGKSTPTGAEKTNSRTNEAGQNRTGNTR